jgi:Mrp family chromosome partitioning ATPase
VADSAELLGRSRLDRVLEAVSGLVDLVVIDTPSILTVPDASVIAARVDRVLLILRAGRSDRALAHAALQQLDAIGAHVIGAVLNDPDSKAAAHGEDAWVYTHAR